MQVVKPPCESKIEARQVLLLAGVLMYDATFACVYIWFIVFFGGSVVGSHVC